MKKLATAPSGSPRQSVKLGGGQRRWGTLLVTLLWTLRLTEGGEMEGSLSSSGAAVRCRLEEDIVQACRSSRGRKWWWGVLLGRFQPTRFTRWKHFCLVGGCIDGRGLHVEQQGRIQLTCWDNASDALGAAITPTLDCLGCVGKGEGGGGLTGWLASGRVPSPDR